MSENLAGDRVKYEEYHFRYSALSQYAIISHMQNFYLQHSYMPQTSWNEFIYDYDHLLSKPYWHVITHNLYIQLKLCHIYICIAEWYFHMFYGKIGSIWMITYLFDHICDYL